MCKGLSYLPSSCLEKAKGMRVKLSHLAEIHHKQKVFNFIPIQNMPIEICSLLLHPVSCIYSRKRTHKEAKVDAFLMLLPLHNCVTVLSVGLQAFRGFLRSEFSEENLEFWLACEDYRVSPSNMQKTKASSIYNQFINPDAPLEVNLDAETREALLSVMDSLCADTFNLAQQMIYSLMAKDSFPRFLRSHHCAEAIKAY
uniref:Regulator of G-protein signaling 5-like n=1 Tax=Poecilia formosa TaxID=48698 RepID=A0A096MEV6_POEFO